MADPFLTEDFDTPSDPFAIDITARDPFAEAVEQVAPKSAAPADPFAIAQEPADDTPLKTPKAPRVELPATTGAQPEAIEPKAIEPERERDNPLEAFAAGFGQNIDALQGMGYSVGAWAADLFGADELRDALASGAARNMREAAKNASKVKFTEIGGIGDAVEWASHGLGSLAPTIATIVASGGVGGLVAGGARAFLPSLGKEAVKRATMKKLVKEVGEDGVKKLGKDQLESALNETLTQMGRSLGTRAITTGMGMGEVFGGFIDPETGDISEGTSKPGRIFGTLAAGLLISKLDNIVPANVIGRLAPTKKEAMKKIMGSLSTGKAAKVAASKVLLGTAEEGITEPLQELISYAAGVSLDEAQTWDWSELKTQLVEAAALGALGGGVMVAPVTAMELTQGKKLEKQQDQSDSDFIERQAGIYNSFKEAGAGISAIADSYVASYEAAMSEADAKIAEGGLDPDSREAVDIKANALNDVVKEFNESRFMQEATDTSVEQDAPSATNPIAPTADPVSDKQSAQLNVQTAREVGDAGSDAKSRALAEESADTSDPSIGLGENGHDDLDTDNALRGVGSMGAMKGVEKTAENKLKHLEEFPQNAGKTPAIRKRVKYILQQQAAVERKIKEEGAASVYKAAYTRFKTRILRRGLDAAPTPQQALQAQLDVYAMDVIDSIDTPSLSLSDEAISEIEATVDSELGDTPPAVSEVEVQTAREVGDTGERQTIRGVVHYSNAPNLNELDPSFHGTGKTGAEAQRKAADPENYIDRIYVGLEGYRKESGLLDNEYNLQVDDELLYNPNDDPAGLLQEAYNEASQGEDPYTLFEKKVAEAGYLGVRVEGEKKATIFSRIPTDRPITKEWWEAETGRKFEPKKVFSKEEFAASAAAEIGRVKAAPFAKEDGATFNADGTPYTGGGIVIGIASQGEFVPTMSAGKLSNFAAKHAKKLKHPLAKIGIYKFPKENNGSYDLNIVVPVEMEAEAVALAKELGQESVYNIETDKNIKTGKDGKNPKSVSDAEFFEIADRFMPNATSDAIRELGGNQETGRVAQDYANSAGINKELRVRNIAPNVPYLQRMADFLEGSENNLDAPGVRASYQALADETMAQYQAMVDAGIEIEPYEGSGEPYASSAEMSADVRNNKHLWFFMTESGFGESAVDKSHPLLQDTGVKINGKDLVYNDLFRAVHDYFGHTKNNSQFGPRGEYNAFLAHADMFTDKAVPALAAETLAQNAWVNYGKHIRRSDGTMPKRGDSDFIPAQDRPFADQKTFIVPASMLPSDLKSDGTRQTVRDVSTVSPEYDNLRVGTAKQGTPAIPLNTPQDSNISGESVPDALMEKHMESFNYDHLPEDIRSETDYKKKREMAIEWMVDNLLALHDSFPAENRARSTHWYDGARKIATDIASRFSVTPTQAAGVIAVLSPQKDWFMNVAQGEQVVDIWQSKRDVVLSKKLIGEQAEQISMAADVPQATKRKKKAGETKLGKTRRQAHNRRLTKKAQDTRRELLSRIEGKTIAELDGDPYLQGWAIRVLAQSIHGRDYSVISPEGSAMGTATKSDGSPQMNGWGSISEIQKAVEILKGVDVSEKLGSKHKVRNFFNNIIAPNSPYGDATIDTHAVAASHLMPFGSSAKPVGHNFGTKISSAGAPWVSGTYHLYMDAYAEAARRRGLMPRQMQSITWEAVRTLYSADDRKSKKVLAKAKDNWKIDGNEKSREEILRKGIPAPEWARPRDGREPGAVAAEPGQTRDQADASGGLRFGGRADSGVVTPKTTRKAPLRRTSQTKAQATTLIKNVTKAAQRMGLRVDVRAPDTTNPDPFFRNVGGKYNPSQKTINLVISSEMTHTDQVVVLHEVLHDLYADAPVAIQEALLRWTTKMSNGELAPLTDRMSTDPRIRPDNPYGLPEMEFQEEQLVESLAAEGVDSQIAEGIVADLIRILKDLWFRAAIKFQEMFNGQVSEEIAIAWAQNKTQAIIAGQSPYLDLWSMVRGGRMSTAVDDNSAMHQGLSSFAYRMSNGKMVLNDLVPVDAEAAIANMDSIIDQGNIEMVMDDTDNRRVGEEGLRHTTERSVERMAQLDVDYFAALQVGNTELADRLVAEAADLAGYNVGPVFHGTTSTDPSFSVFDINRGRREGFHFGSEEQARSRVKTKIKENKVLKREGVASEFSEDLIRPFYLSGDLAEIWDNETNSAESISEEMFNDGEISKEQQARIYWATVKRDVAAGDNVKSYKRNGLAEHEKKAGKLNKAPEDYLREFAGESVYYYDNGVEGDGRSYAIFNPNQIKSADTITRDDNGQVIPLSQRFQVESDNIRFTQRPVAATLAAQKEQTMRRLESSVRRDIASMNELDAALAPTLNKLSPAVTREEFFGAIPGLSDPRLEIQKVLIAYESNKNLTMPDYQDSVSANDRLDTLTDAQNAVAREKTYRSIQAAQRQLGESVSSNIIQSEESAAKIEAKEEAYNALIAKMGDLKETEREVRKGISQQISLLLEDLRANNRAQSKKGIAGQILQDLTDKNEGLPFPKSTEKLLKGLINNDTPLLAIAREMMKLDIEWSGDGTDVYKAALAAIKEEIKVNLDSPLGELLSGKPFEVGAASLKALVESGDVDSLRGSAFLATMVAFVKNNRQLADALEASNQSAQVNLEIAEGLAAVKNAKVIEDANRILDIYRTKTPNGVRDRIVISFAKAKQEMNTAKKALAKSKKNAAMLSQAAGDMHKAYNKASKAIGKNGNWTFQDGAEVPIPVSNEQNPREVLYGKHEEIDMTQFGENVQGRKDGMTYIGKMAKRITDYLGANQESKDTYEYQELSRIAEALGQQYLEAAVVQADPGGLGFRLRDPGSQMRNSGTVAGTRVAGRLEEFTKLNLKYQGQVFDGYRFSRKYRAARKAAGMGSNDAFYRMANKALAFLEGERVLDGQAAFDAMFDALSIDPNMARALSQKNAKKEFQALLIEWARQSQAMDNVRANEGLLVRDEGGDVNPFTGVERDLYRDSLNRGLFMVPRVLSRGVFSAMSTWMKVPGNEGVLTSDSPLNVNDYADNPDGVAARVSQILGSNSSFFNRVVNPFILNDRSNKYPHPQDDAVKLDLSVVAAAWSESGQDVVKTAEILADQYGVDPTEYVPKFFSAFKSQLVKFQKKNSEAQKSARDANMGGVSMFAADSRVDDDFPSEMTEYITFSHQQNSVSIKQIAIEKAMGRNMEGLYADIDATARDINEQADAYNSAVADSGGDMAAVKKLLGKNFKIYQAASKAEKLGTYEAKRWVDNMKSILGNSDNMSDIGMWETGFGMVITGLLSGWKTGLKQLSQVYSGFMGDGAISRWNYLDPFQKTMETGVMLASWPFRLFGMGFDFKSVHRTALLDAGVRDFEGAVPISDRFSDLGFDREFERDGRSWTKKIARGIQSAVSGTTFHRGERKQFSPSGSLVPFRALNMSSAMFDTNSVMKKMIKISEDVSAYLKENPNAVESDITAENLGYKDRLWGWDDATDFTNFKTQLNAAQGISLIAMANEADARKADGKYPLSKDTIASAYAFTKTNRSFESTLVSRPTLSQKTPVGRMSLSLLGWSLEVAMHTTDLILGRDTTGRRRKEKEGLASSIAGLKAIMFGVMPYALLYSMFFDFWDEEISGKKSDIRPLTTKNGLDELAMSVLERVGNMGPIGLWGEAANSAVNMGSGKKVLSFDERVVWASTLMSAQNMLSTFIAVEGFKDPANLTYNTFWRPVLQTMGFGGTLSNTQVINNVFGFDNAESRTAGRTNVNNALRGAGRSVGVEVRVFGSGGSSRPTPMTPHVTNMILAALSDDGERFEKSYDEAVRVTMKSKDISQGEAQDKVKRSFASRHPIKSVFRSPPTTKEYQQMLAVMNPNMRFSVEDGLASFSKWGQTIGVKPYFGKRVKQTEQKKLADAPRRPTMGGNINDIIQSQFEI